MTSDAGALITLAAIKCPAISGKYGCNMATYEAITPPATVAMPPVIIANNSDFVIFSTYGLTTSGASVIPTKIFATDESDSAPDTPMNFIIKTAIPFTIHCMMPKWYRTVISELKKIIGGNMLIAVLANADSTCPETKLENKNVVPADVKSSSTVTASLRNEKIAFPTDVRKINNAKTS